MKNSKNLLGPGLIVPERYYINLSPDDRGYYGGLKLDEFPGAVILPRLFLNFYIENYGFVIPTIENGIVISLKCNIEAYNAFIASLSPLYS